METTTNPEATMTSTEQLDYFQTRVAEGIAQRMAEGATYEQATREAFDYCNRRWPTLVAAILAK